jgi:hypothetical protein
MTLTKEQKRQLSNLTDYLRKMEKQKAEDNIDLDVFMTDYSNGDISIYATERIELDRKSKKRKQEFEQSAKEKIASKSGE